MYIYHLTHLNSKKGGSMKKLLLITLALASQQAFGLVVTNNKSKQEFDQQQSVQAEEESLLQNLSKAPIFLKLKNQLSEQYPGLFDKLAAGDVSGLLNILGSKLQNIISSSFNNLTPALQDIKPADITIADLRTLKSDLDNYAQGIGYGQKIDPKLKEIFDATKDAYKKLIESEKTFSNVVNNKNIAMPHHAQEFLQALFYNIIEGDTASTKILPNEFQTLKKAPQSETSVLDALGKFLGF